MWEDCVSALAPAGTDVLLLRGEREIGTGVTPKLPLTRVQFPCSYTFGACETVLGHVLARLSLHI